MKIKITFTDEESRLLKDGYKEQHKRPLDDDTNEARTVAYGSIHSYIALGKKVGRRRARSDFIDSWGSAIFWILVIAGFATLSLYNIHRKSLENQRNIESSQQEPSNSPSSGIYYAEECPITTCNDGSCSSSTGRGTCSHHGGVRSY